MKRSKTRRVTLEIFCLRGNKIVAILTETAFGPCQITFSQSGRRVLFGL
jgi:hypothetical protein